MAAQMQNDLPSRESDIDDDAELAAADAAVAAVELECQALAERKRKVVQCASAARNAVAARKRPRLESDWEEWKLQDEAEAADEAARVQAVAERVAAANADAERHRAAAAERAERRQLQLKVLESRRAALLGQTEPPGLLTAPAEVTAPDVEPLAHAYVHQDLRPRLLPAQLIQHSRLVRRRP